MNYQDFHCHFFNEYMTTYLSILLLLDIQVFPNFSLFLHCHFLMYSICMILPVGLLFSRIHSHIHIFDNKSIEIFTHHTFHPFEAYCSRAFSIFPKWHTSNTTVHWETLSSVFEKEISIRGLAHFPHSQPGPWQPLISFLSL